MTGITSSSDILGGSEFAKRTRILAVRRGIRRNNGPVVSTSQHIHHCTYALLNFIVSLLHTTYWYYGSVIINVSGIYFLTSIRNQDPFSWLNIRHNHQLKCHQPVHCGILECDAMLQCRWLLTSRRWGYCLNPQSMLN